MRRVAAVERALQVNKVSGRQKLGLPARNEGAGDSRTTLTSGGGLRMYHGESLDYTYVFS